MPKITLTNSTLKQAGGNLHLLPFTVNYEELFTNSEDRKELREVLNTYLAHFESQLGFTTTLNSKDIIDFILNVSKAYAMLATYVKRYNARNLTDYKGSVIGSIFAIEDVPYSSNYLIRGSAATEMKTVSHAVYQQKVARLLNIFYIPNQMFNVITYFSSNYFSNNMNDGNGASTVIDLFALEYAKGNLIDLVDVYIEKAHEAISSHPTLIMFLETYMGINKENLLKSVSLDLDMAGNSISMIDDHNLVTALQTTIGTVFPGLTAGGEPDVYEVWHRVEEINDFRNSVNILNEDMEDLYFRIMNIHTTVETAPIRSTLYLVELDSTRIVALYPILPGLNVSWHEEALTQENVNLLTSALRTWPFTDPFTANVTTNSQGVLTPLARGAVIREGYDIFLFNEEDALIAKNDLLSAMWFSRPANSFGIPYAVNRHINQGITIGKKESKTSEKKEAVNQNRNGSRRNERKKRQTPNKPESSSRK